MDFFSIDSSPPSCKTAPSAVRRSSYKESWPLLRGVGNLLVFNYLARISLNIIFLSLNILSHFSIYIYSKSFLPVTRSNSWLALLYANRYVEFRVYLSWVIYRVSIVSWREWGRTVSMYNGGHGPTS